MKRLDKKKVDIDIAKFKKRTAKRSDVSSLIKEDIIIYDNNEPVIFYKKLDEDTSAFYGFEPLP